MAENAVPPNVRDLEQYRFYLKILARVRLRAAPRHLDAADIVQETLGKAHERRMQFRGETEAEWLAWMRTILSNTVNDKINNKRA